MKRITSILILSLFIYNSIGFLAIHPFISMYYKYVGIQRADMPSKEEMIELMIFNIEDIENNKIDFRWIHSREFKYNGDMYDIVKKEEDDKQLFVYCINDTKEKKLEVEFDRAIHKNSSEDKQRPTTNNYYFISLSEPVQTEQPGITQVDELLFSYWWTDSYTSLHLDIHSPPPRLT